MKRLSIDDIEKIRLETLDKVNQGKDRKDIRISVGMGTCGIAAGAGLVYDVIQEEIKNKGLENVILEKVGCIGACRLEPIVEVIKPGEEKTTYVKVTPNKIRKIIKNHVVDGTVVKEFTIHLIENTILNDFTIIGD